MDGIIQRGVLVLLACIGAGCSHTPRPVIVDRFYQADGRPVWSQPRYMGDDKRRVLHGTARYWYRSGGPQDRISYRHGVLQGGWTHWYEHGPKAFTCTYRDGVLHGAVTVWDGEGMSVCSGIYRYGSEHEGSFYRPAPEGSGPACMAGEVVTVKEGNTVNNTAITDLSAEAVVALRVFWERTPPNY